MNIKVRLAIWVRRLITDKFSLLGVGSNLTSGTFSDFELNYFKSYSSKMCQVEPRQLRISIKTPKFNNVKLQAVKLFSFFFLYNILSYENSATYEHFWFFWNTKSLTACNFAAPLGTWTTSTFLEASNLTLFGARWSWEW